MKSDRLVQIKQILLKEGKLTNTDLCRRFGISMATARRDLDILEAEGAIRRIYGGAVPAQKDDETQEIPRWERRRREGLSEKEAVALRAVE
ncbi:MAG: DeoR/GlpR transcriptional regulator, partial [Clostridia bacterium]|nr:DeoR/GlpR transcriptional regulator [Clostridia bacterium]